MNFRTLKRIESLEEQMLNAIKRLEQLEKPNFEERPTRRRVSKVRKQKDDVAE